MSNHEKAYLICENKCMVEGIPKDGYPTFKKLTKSLTLSDLPAEVDSEVTIKFDLTNEPAVTKLSTVLPTLRYHFKTNSSNRIETLDCFTSKDSNHLSIVNVRYIKDKVENSLVIISSTNEIEVKIKKNLNFPTSCYDFNCELELMVINF